MWFRLYGKKWQKNKSVASATVSWVFRWSVMPFSDESGADVPVGTGMSVCFGELWGRRQASLSCSGFRPMKVIIVFLRFLTQFAFRWKFQYLCNSRAANLIETGRFLLVFKAFKRQKSPFLNSEKYYLEFEFPISALKFRYGLFRSPYFKPLFYHLHL